MTNLKNQTCSNCKYSRSNGTTTRDTMLSCRYTPPTPGVSDNSWRVVPEDFWCGKWEKGGVWEDDEIKPVSWRID